MIAVLSSRQDTDNTVKVLLYTGIDDDPAVAAAAIAAVLCSCCCILLLRMALLLLLPTLSLPLLLTVALGYGVVS